MFQSKKKKAIKGILAAGAKEIINAEIMIDFYTWQKDNAPEEATTEELAKIDLKIKQMEDIIANNTRVNDAFKVFLSQY